MQCLDRNSDSEDDSSDDSEDEEDGLGNSNRSTTRSSNTRIKRDVPHSSFALALKSSRLQSSRRQNVPWGSGWFLNGNPKYGNQMLLYCRTQVHLTVAFSGRVGGTNDETDRFARMEILSAGIAGHVKIKGMESELYVTMDKKGKVYGEVRNDMEGSVWLEEYMEGYNTYMSRYHALKGWHLAIKRNGKPKRGNRTSWRQKAIQFLPRRIY